MKTWMRMLVLVAVAVWGAGLFGGCAQEALDAGLADEPPAGTDDPAGDPVGDPTDEPPDGDPVDRRDPIDRRDDPRIGDPPADPSDDPAPPTTLAGCSTDGAQPWSSADRVKPGPFFVGDRELIFVDPDRETPANGLVPKLDSRTLHTKVWYPAKKGLLGDLTPSFNAELAREDGPFPLVVHSHGFMSDKNEGEYFARHLASHGFVVAAPNFPLSTGGTLGGPTVLDVENQPGDVSFLIDNLLGHTLASDSPLFGAVDPEVIALTGVSLGGLTTLLTTFHPQVLDPRIKAAIPLAAPSWFFTEKFYAHAPVPTLFVHGDIDAIIDYESNAAAAHHRAAPLAGLATLVGGTHTSFATAAGLMEGIFDNTDQIGCEAIAGNIDADTSFMEAFASEEDGIVFEGDPPEICVMDPLPPAMAPSLQHDLTKLAIRAFLDLQFGDDATRASACEFLLVGLGADHAEITVEP